MGLMEAGAGKVLGAEEAEVVGGAAGGAAGAEARPEGSKSPLPMLPGVTAEVTIAAGMMRGAGA